MSDSLANVAHELNCPNCGASYALPSGNQVGCAYCGSRFLIPESVRRESLTPATIIDLSTRATQLNLGPWVRWIVIFIVVVTVVPIACSLVATICGVLAPLAALFFK